VVRVHLVSIVPGVVALLAVLPARAEPTDQETALALTLFDEGRAALAAGHLDEACHELEESKRLDPLPGTVLNLAVCHEHQGRVATASAEFREARALAERDHRDDRVALADQHLEALARAVSDVVIVVPSPADRADLAVSADGTSVGRAAWGTRIPVDPGPHTIEATAPNKKTWTLVVQVAPNGDVETATVPQLEDAPSEPGPVLPPAVVPPPVARVAGLSGSPVPAPPASAASRALSTRRTIALASAGASLVAAGIGTYFGVTAISKHDDPDAICTLEPCTQANALNSDAKSAADASTVSFAVALVALGTGAFLWFGDTSGARADRAHLEIVPDAGWGRAGLRVGGDF
jgi:hypothetical protein